MSLRSLNGLSTINVDVTFDSTDFFQLSGRVGGQVGNGGSLSGDNLTLQSNPVNDGLIIMGGDTQHNGDIIFNETTNDLTLAAADQVTGVATATLPDLGGVSQDLVLTSQTQTMTNKTMTDTSNNVTSTGLFSATTTVAVSGAAAPTAGQVLTATNGTTATWQAAAASAIDGANIGTAGVGPFAQRNGDDLEFRNINTANSSNITVTLDAGNNEIDLDIGTDVVTLTGSQTLTNKTLTSPIISTISNTGTLTLPTSTDTLVGRDTTDTLTNKTATASSNDITARALFSNSGANTVSVFASANPSVGYVLTATGATTATWQAPGASAGGWTDDGVNVRLTTSTDSVGIGTAGPTEKLEVAGNILINNSAAVSFEARSSASSSIITSARPNTNELAQFSWETTGTGTDWLLRSVATTRDLELLGSGNSHLRFTRDATATTSSTGTDPVFSLVATGNDAAYQLSKLAEADDATVVFQTNAVADWTVGTVADDDFHFSSDTLTDQVVLTNSANGGMVTKGQLHVEGVAATVPLLVENNSAAVLPTTLSGQSGLFVNNDTASDACAVSIIAGTTGSAQLSFGDSADVDIGLISYSNSTNSMVFTTNNNPAMTIDSAGEVGVGTITPSALLHVTNGGTTPTLVGGETLIVQNNTNAGDICRLTIVGGTSGNSILNFGDASDVDAGALEYNHVLDRLIFRAGASNEAYMNTGEFSPNADFGLDLGNGATNRWRRLHTDLPIITQQFDVVRDTTGLYGRAVSDSRLKKDVSDYIIDWDDFMAVTPKTYTWKTVEDLEAEASNPARDAVLAQDTWVGGNTGCGFIAQDLDVAYGECTTGDDVLGFNGNQMNHILWAAIRDLKTRIDVLESA